MYFLEFFNRNMGIDLRAIEAAVSQELLNKAHISAIVEHVRCAAMP